LSFNGNLYEEDEGLELTTKGQVHTYSTENTALNVGADGFILSADSTEATGLKYIANTDAGLTLGSKGDIHTRDAANQAALAVGTNIESLYANSATTTGLEWETNARKTLTGTGDILYSSAANTLARLGAGSNGDVLTLAAGVPSWAAASGGAWERISSQTQTGGSSEFNITGLSNTGDFLYWQAYFSYGGADYLKIRFGAGGSIDTGSNYSWNQEFNGGTASYSTGTSVVTQQGTSSHDSYCCGCMNLNASEDPTTISQREGIVWTYRTSETCQTGFAWEDGSSPITNIRFYANGGNDIMGTVNIFASGT
jgi:hypothetical protein